MTHPFARYAFVLSLLGGAMIQVAVPVSTWADQVGTQSYRLARINATGIGRFSVADVAGVSGLQIGQMIAAADLSTIANRMVESGLFGNVAYRYVTSAGEMTLTFEIQETAWDVPVSYENFVWFSDDELRAAILEDVPTYADAVPANGMLNARIARALDRLLAMRRIPGTVTSRALTTIGGATQFHLFSVINPMFLTCAVRFEGTDVVSQRTLLDTSQDVVGSPYSRRYVREFAASTLVQPYRRKGHWKAVFEPPSVTIPPASACDGVTVMFRVSEGIAYRFAGMEWIGREALPTSQLDRMIDLDVGDVADGAALDEGLREVRKAYGKLGHLMQTAAFEPVIDDVAKQVRFRVRVTEGPRFRMGTFTVEGMKPADAESLAKKWKLRPGDIFDESVMMAFRDSALRPSGPSAPHSEMEMTGGDDDVINVRIVVK